MFPPRLQQPAATAAGSRAKLKTLCRLCFPISIVRSWSALLVPKSSVRQRRKSNFLPTVARRAAPPGQAHGRAPPPLRWLRINRCNVVPRLPHAFSAERRSGAEILIVIAPGVERFEYFRQLTRIAQGKEPPEGLRDVQDLYDTYFLNSPEWEAARK